MTTDAYLASIPQWLPVLLVPRADGRTDKLPCDWRSGSPCNAHEAQFWASYDRAVEAARRFGTNYTVGFVLTVNDDLFAVDIDGALQADGTWSPLANELAAALPGCYIEVSQSGRGLHIWGRYPSPPEHRKKNVPLHIECYTEARFVAIGVPLAGAIAGRCDAFPAVLARWFPPAEVNAQAVPATGPRADWRGPTDDTELLRRAMQSKSAAAMFGGAKATFADLWLADEDALSRAYPADPGSMEAFDRSSADAALASHLAFWTGADVGRIERLMRQSKLAREKWDDRSDYLVARTITNACNVQKDVLQDKPKEDGVEVPAATVSAPPAPPAPPAPAKTALRLVEGSTFLTPAEQANMFAGCTYILDQHKVLLPDGRLLAPDRFKAWYGGFTFVMDNRNEKTSRDAWEAITQSQALRAPRVDGTCYRPKLPFGAVVGQGGRKFINIYVAAEVRLADGDITPLLQHLEKLFPHQYDRNVVLYYMACCVQNLGSKAQWALVLQGVEGNGKSFLVDCLRAAIGAHNTYTPRASRIGGQFNAYVSTACMLFLEEIMVNGRQELMDELKPMITSSILESEKKGVDQVNVEICFNIFATTNHKNAILKTRNDRRWCLAQCKQQEEADLARDGVTESYMYGLYSWWRNGGEAIVNKFLRTVPVPAEFDFTRGLQRAPKLSSFEDTIRASLGVVEQEVLEAVGREEIGFKGGWVSSGFLDKLLQRLGKDRAVPINKRKELMESLGYVWHPALTDGRVNNAVLPDGAKVKLFVRADRADLKALQPAEAATAYTRAQGIDSAGAPGARA